MIWKSLRPKYCLLASFCMVSFWWIFQKQKNIYTDQAQLKPLCSTGKWSTFECPDLLWQIRKCWVTHCSQMSDFPSRLSYFDLLTLHRSRDKSRLMVPSVVLLWTFPPEGWIFMGMEKGSTWWGSPGKHGRADLPCKASAQLCANICLKQAGVSNGGRKSS